MKNPTIRGVNILIANCRDNCTFENHKPDCPRIIKIIITESPEVNGRKDVNNRTYRVYNNRPLEITLNLSSSYWVSGWAFHI